MLQTYFKSKWKKILGQQKLCVILKISNIFRKVESDKKKVIYNKQFLPCYLQNCIYPELHKLQRFHNLEVGLHELVEIL